MRKINPDGTLKGYEFQEGYDPNASPIYTPIPNGEDLIDFPCSPGWVRHFANQGLTKDYPSDFYIDKKPLQPGEVTMNDRLLEGGGVRGEGRGIGYYELQEIRGQMLHIQSKLNEHIDKAKKRLKDAY